MKGVGSSNPAELATGQLPVSTEVGNDVGLQFLTVSLHAVQLVSTPVLSHF